jgi:hypothetical protein
MRGSHRGLPAHILLAYLFAIPCSNLRAETKGVWQKLWSASVASVVAANVADAATSLGRYEGNPLLRNAQGRLSPGRVVLIKASGTGGLLLLQCILRRRMPHQRLEKPAAIINFTAAAAVGAVAYRNSTISKAPAPSP